MPKATGPIYNVPFKRRRQRLTNYRKRLALLKSKVTRLVVRKTNKRVIVHFVDYSDKGDITRAAANSSELLKLGWKPSTNLPTAYLTGMLAAKKAVKAGVKKAILDVGLHKPCKSSFVFVAARGAADGGIDLGLADDIADADRLTGKHVSEFAKSTGKQDPTANFEQVKSKIGDVNGK